MSIHSFIHQESGQRVYLGRRITPHAERPPTLRFGAYWNAPSWTPPDTLDFTPKATAAISQMYGNNQYGDCVVAESYHSFGMWTAMESGTPAVGTTDEAVNTYFSACGGGDNGCDITAFLDYVKTTGITIGGQKHIIDSYVAVDWTNWLEVQAAMYIFGPLSLGVNLPGSWENSQIWDVTNSGMVGGHGIPTCGWNAQGPPIATWGGTRQMTKAAFTGRTYVDECLARLTKDWYLNNNLSPMGIDVSTMVSDSQKLANGQIPDINPANLWSWDGFA